MTAPREENLIKGSTELNQMFLAVQTTGAGLRRDFGEVENLQQSLDGAADFVKKAAARIEEAILSELILIRPNAGILTHNYSRDGDGRDEFVLGLSGAENFTRGIGHFAISLALRTNGETKIALIYSPIDDRLYYAEAGAGAFVFSAYHSIKINVSRRRTNTLTLGRDRITGCTALDMAWIASGKADAMRADMLAFAEIAAGDLLVREAGGSVIDNGGELTITNGLL
ncbi:MAG: hypothetical protein LBO08_03615 [Rickettsiales bacterium]|jgi:myo-inositol-1(or 4)-monophosphatase|nr:hypothetical protein [Rickettsiales bacterium]